MFKRSIKLSDHETFFLWGPRQSGKSTLLRQCFPDAVWIDLLKADEFRRYSDRPEILRTEILPSKKGAFVVIDEIQKVPSLLDEVHWLIENRKIRFALCGSSARKVRQGHANLLGGRALRCELFGLVSSELGKSFELTRALNHGYLPRHYLSADPRRLLNSYVADYLKEEIASEGLVRNLPKFSGFLDAASLSDTEMINVSTIARECAVSSHTAREYFEILVDTLLGRWLPAYRKRPKRRVIGAPKFYFADVGVVNALSKRGNLAPGSELFGKAFENWVHHELSAYSQYSSELFDLSYWRLASGIEVDFIVADMRVAIEAKAVSSVQSHHLKGLRELIKDHSKVKRRVLVCLEPRVRKTEDGIDILPFAEFAAQLWDGSLLE